MEFDDESYSCSDKDVSLDEGDENQIVHRECVFRCNSDYCNFGPGLKFANFVNATTEEPVTEVPASSFTLGFNAMILMMALIVKKWI